jgi:hypothetical protein
MRRTTSEIEGSLGTSAKVPKRAREAKDHGSFIAHRIGTEKPGMIRDGNFISVTDELGKELYKIPLASVMV